MQNKILEPIGLSLLQIQEYCCVDLHKVCLVHVGGHLWLLLAFKRSDKSAVSGSLKQGSR